MKNGSVNHIINSRSHLRLDFQVFESGKRFCTGQTNAQLNPSLYVACLSGLSTSASV